MVPGNYLTETQVDVKIKGDFSLNTDYNTTSRIKLFEVMSNKV